VDPPRESGRQKPRHCPRPNRKAPAASASAFAAPGQAVARRGATALLLDETGRAEIAQPFVRILSLNERGCRGAIRRSASAAVLAGSGSPSPFAAEKIDREFTGQPNFRLVFRMIRAPFHYHLVR